MEITPSNASSSSTMKRNKTEQNEKKTTYYSLPPSSTEKLFLLTCFFFVVFVAVVWLHRRNRIVTPAGRLRRFSTFSRSHTATTNQPVAHLLGRNVHFPFDAVRNCRIIDFPVRSCRYCSCRPIHFGTFVAVRHRNPRAVPM